jgi:hypothetical protein
MKRILLALILVVTIPLYVWGADVKISALPDGGASVATTSTLLGVVGGNTSRFTAAQLLALKTSVSGNAGTATALAADPANCAAGQIALGITAAGVAECTATPSGLTSVGATTFTGALSGNADTATALAANPAACSAGEFVTDIAANGTLTCSTPSGAAHDALTLDTTSHVDDVFSLSTQRLDFDTQTANYVLAGPNTGAAAAPTFRALVSADIPTNAAATSSSAASLSVSGQTGLMTVTGLTSTNRAKTVRDAADTVLELGGSYTPTGTWNVGSMTFTSPPWQASDTELTALAGLTFADASIVQLTGAGTAAVLTSGGNNRLLGSNSDNTTLEFKSTVSGITFGGFTASRSIESDGSGNLVVSGTATTGTGAPVKGTAPQISTIELGHASDTTLGRTSAGIANIEASNIILGTLGATTNVIPKANGTGTVTLAASGITEDGTNVSIGALNLVTTGNISGNVAVIDMGNTAATYAMGASDAYGKMFLQTHGDAATDVTLPDYQAAGASDHVKVGSTVCIMTLTAYATLIHPSADDKIRTSNGTLNAAGVE